LTPGSSALAPRRDVRLDRWNANVSVARHRPERRRPGPSPA
jgi:hypothetical protein